MTFQIRQWLKKVKKQYIQTPGKVLEIGNHDHSSRARLELNYFINDLFGINVSNTVKKYFPDASEYTGIDLKRGPNVDIILNAHHLHKQFETNYFDTILCLEVLEHDPQPWKIIENIHKTLKSGGFLAISTPTFGFPEHRYPKDYYRFGLDAYKEVIFKNLKILDITQVKDFRGYPGICGLAKKVKR